jgi:Protein of unknown function (DUF3187)
MRGTLTWVLLSAASLVAQETPRPNRVAWFEIFPEPLPDGRSALALEATSQFLRLDKSRSAEGRSIARLDGEEWQLTADLAKDLGFAQINLRLRGAQRSGGIADQAFVSYHKVLGLPDGGRLEVPKYQTSYRLERDGVVIAQLSKPTFQVFDADLALLKSFGDPQRGARMGLSIQLPNGRASDFSGSGGLDGVIGGGAWRGSGPWRVHGQAEVVFIGLPSNSDYRRVLGPRRFHRAWAGLGWQGDGSGFWGGFGLDLSVAWSESPYRTGLARLDGSGWQQHWTLSHRAIPKWRFGISEEAGTYTAPDITAFVSYRLGDR